MILLSIDTKTCRVSVYVGRNRVYSETLSRLPDSEEAEVIRRNPAELFGAPPPQSAA